MLLPTKLLHSSEIHILRPALESEAYFLSKIDECQGTSFLIPTQLFCTRGGGDSCVLTPDEQISQILFEFQFIGVRVIIFSNKHCIAKKKKERCAQCNTMINYP